MGAPPQGRSWAVQYSLAKRTSLRQALSPLSAAIVATAASARFGAASSRVVAAGSRFVHPTQLQFQLQSPSHSVHPHGQEITEGKSWLRCALLAPLGY